MSIQLLSVIQSYIDASNAHDVNSILACFTEDAVVRDENETRQGKLDIERWITKTIAKYKFQFRPISAQESDSEVVVKIEVSGTFPGSPVILDYHFTTSGNQISSLTIDS